MDDPSSVVVCSGHMFEAGASEEAALAAKIAETLTALSAREAFGPLAYISRQPRLTAQPQQPHTRYWRPRFWPVPQGDRN